MIHHNSCPICSSENLVKKHTCTDHFVSKESFVVAQCSNCGFTFTQDHPDEHQAGRYYESEEYISHSDTSQGIINKLYRTARSMMLKRKVKLVKKVCGRTTGNVLDIGSGRGYFVNAMLEAGWKAEGIEINDRARKLSQKEFGIVVHEPDEIKNLSSETFNCITLWHVLEHFYNPETYLDEVFRLLKSDGVCIAALPNSKSFDASYYKENWAAWDVPRHLWHFSPETLMKLAAKHGFKLVETRTLPLDVFYVSMLSEKYTGSAMHFIKGLIIGKMFFIKSLFSKDKASSLMYILTKK